MELRGARRIFDSSAIPGRIVDVLAVRTDALRSHPAALRHLLQCHFAARTLMLESPQRCSALLAKRLQTPAEEVMALFRGLRLPDLAQNRSMLAPDGAVDQAARALQTLMVEAGLLPPATAQQALADLQYLPV
jgi:NitT/TauT family transport system substrate-binding protein